MEDTLLGYKLNPYLPKLNTKEVKHPKFYLFDPGVARGCANLLNDDVDPTWLGFAFETLVINEVRAYNHYLKFNRNLFYYKFSGGYEIDLLIENRKKTISTKQSLTAIEIKSSIHWDKRWNDTLFTFKEKAQPRIQKIIGVYQGKRTLNFGDLRVYPVEEFLLRLSQGEFFRA